MGSPLDLDIKNFRFAYSLILSSAFLVGLTSKLNPIDLYLISTEEEPIKCT